MEANKCESTDMLINRLKDENEKLKQDLRMQQKKYCELIEYIRSIKNFINLVEGKINNSY